MIKEMDKDEHQEFGDVDKMEKEDEKHIKRLDGLPTVNDLSKLLSGFKGEEDDEGEGEGEGEEKGKKIKGMMVIRKMHGPMQLGGSCGHQDESKIDSLKQFLDGLMGLLR